MSGQWVKHQQITSCLLYNMLHHSVWWVGETPTNYILFIVYYVIPVFHCYSLMLHQCLVSGWNTNKLHPVYCIVCYTSVPLLFTNVTPQCLVSGWITNKLHPVYCIVHHEFYTPVSDQWVKHQHITPCLLYSTKCMLY